MGKKWTAKQREAYQTRLANEYNDTLQLAYSMLKRKGAEKYGSGTKRLQVQDIVQANVIPVKTIVHPTREHVNKLKKFIESDNAQFKAIYHSFEKKTTTAKRYKEGTEEYRQRKQLQILMKMSEAEDRAISRNKRHVREGTQFMNSSAKHDKFNRSVSADDVTRAIQIICGYIVDLENVKLDFDIEYRDCKKYMLITKKRIQRLMSIVNDLKKMLEECPDDILVFRAKEIEHLYSIYGAPSINHFTYVDKEVDADITQGVEIMDRLDDILNMHDNLAKMLTGTGLEEAAQGVMREAAKRQKERDKEIQDYLRKQAEEIARKSRGIT